MQRFSGYICGFLLAFLVAPNHAGASQLGVQRGVFVTAEKALQSHNRTVFESLKTALKDYPLFPYLLYRDLQQRMNTASAAEIRSFLRAYENLPLAGRLRSAWLERLAKEQRWSDFRQDYRDGNTALRCFYRQALLAAGRKEDALRDIEQIWMSGGSLPDACDPVFAFWRSQGGFTAERVWRRLTLTMGSNRLGLSRYLQRQLPETDRKWVDIWFNVHHNPSLLLKPGLLKTTDPRSTDIVLHGLRRWKARDSVAAAAALDNLKARYRLPVEETQVLERQLAVQIAARGHPTAMTRLVAIPPELADKAVQEWRVRVALQQHDWQLVLKGLDNMTPDIADRPQWRYWRARALGATAELQQALAVYQGLAEERDYHGFLAADRLNLDYRIETQPVAVSAEAVDALERLPGILRARELYLLGRYRDARTEWANATESMPEETLKAAAKLASRWGWHEIAIATIARTGHWDDLELRFPTPYREEIGAYARAKGIDPAWVYAVMRQESLFQPDARSSAGALGLMQIMPATGRRIARDLSVRLPGNHALLRTDTNIRLGTHYLRYTLNRLQRNPVLATAAYNAGPHKVSQWLPEQDAIPADLWAETIPYYETREYIKRIMEYTMVYRWRLGQAKTSLQARMAEIHPN